MIVSRSHLRLIETAATIQEGPPDRMMFMHSVLCHVGLPRRRMSERMFERRSGNASVLLEAGNLYNGSDWVEQPLPYGTVPRLVMAHVSSEAVRTRSRVVEIGDSARQFLLTLGMQTGGGSRGGYAALKRQIEALAACQMTIGTQANGRAITVDAKPIKRFEAWIQKHESQPTLWPGSLELSEEFYSSLTEHAVPLDHRALAALKSSALAIDIYTWLAHRLCRIAKPQGVKLSWTNLREQFGQEYLDHRNFKRKFRRALQQVRVVYPDARMGDVIGGFMLYPSHPPLVKTGVCIRLTQ